MPPNIDLNDDPGWKSGEVFLAVAFLSRWLFSRLPARNGNLLSGLDGPFWGITGVYGPPIFGQLQSLSTITNLTLTLIFSLIPI